MGTRLFKRLIEEAGNLPRETVAVDYFLKELYAAHIAGLGAGEPEKLEEAAMARRPPTPDERVATATKYQGVGKLAGKVLRRLNVQPRIPGLLPHHRPRSLPPEEVRKARRQRRNALAHGKRGVLIPPTEAACLTTGEMAVLTQVGIEIINRGFCDLYVAQIGAFAGCGERKARIALRLGEKLGLMTVTERRQGQYNETNIITPTPKWNQWLKGREAWKNNRHFSSGDPSSSPKKENKEKEKGSAGTQGASSVPSSRPVEPPTKPVIVTDLRSAQEKAKDDAWFERVISEIRRQ